MGKSESSWLSQISFTKDPFQNLSNSSKAQLWVTWMSYSWTSHFIKPTRLWAHRNSATSSGCNCQNYYKLALGLELPNFLNPYLGYRNKNHRENVYPTLQFHTIEFWDFNLRKKIKSKKGTPSAWSSYFKSLPTMLKQNMYIKSRYQLVSMNS